MFALLGLLLAQPLPVVEPPMIVVTGTRIEEDREKLAACLRRRCPPAEEMEASLRLAENLFVAGNYREARGAVFQSIRRNKDQSKTYPLLVAGLYRAQGRISIHEGEGELYRQSIYDVVRSLRSGLPATSPELLMGRLEVGDMQLNLGMGRPAEKTYQDVERRAERLDLPAIAGMAQLRRAMLLNISGRTWAARGILTRIFADPSMPESFRLAARVLFARMARAGGDTAATEQLIADFAKQSPQDGLVLLYAPSLQANGPSARIDPSEVRLRGASSEGFAGRWADIGFWVKPDGSVAEAEVLRSAGSAGWTAPVLRSVAGRRYAPLSGGPASPGRYRVERFSYTSLYQYTLGSHVRERSGVPRVETLDLTADEPTPPR